MNGTQVCGQSVSAHPKIEEILSISEPLHTVGPNKQVSYGKYVNILLLVSFNICFKYSKEPSH